MKKICVILVFLLALTGCKSSKTPDFDSGFTIETYECDMSVYDGMNSTNHHFLATNVDELERTINEKGYGIFVLSNSLNCPYCKPLMQYMEKAAEELDVYIYYIDAYSERYPIAYIDDSGKTVFTDDYDRLFEIVKPICNVFDGEPQMQTPTLFTIIDGEIVDYKIGAEYEGNEPNEKEAEKITQEYIEIMKPFSRA